MKLGSLFDGIGTFPLSGLQHGIIPVWASEIEAFPIKVTKHHFPNMKHLGDITQINGGEIEPVDIITFGSPCQDLSVAGKREGLAGERSGLFMDAIRIIRQMRDATGGEYPRFAVWENVPGAFSSNKGEDFRAVLEEITEAEIPMPRSGKWATAGMVRTERVDVAWRVLDAQYWGVPQRRRRIFLVADFAGQCAGEILFVEPRLSWNFETGGEAGQKITPSTRTSVIESMQGGNVNGQTKIADTSSLLRELWRTIGSQTFEKWVRGTLDILQTKEVLLSEVSRRMEGETTKETTMCKIWATSCEEHFAEGHLRDMWESKNRDSSQGRKSFEQFTRELNAVMQELPQLNPRQGREMSALWQTDKGTRLLRKALSEIQAMGRSKDSKNQSTYTTYAVRRLVPVECLRLQGFPDNWLDIEGMSDTAKYKAVGNSVAVPCVEFVMSGIARCLR